jgi:hypothetical protein
MLSAVILSEFRVLAKINLHFLVLRRLSGKAPKCRNIEIFMRFGNAARQDASAHKNVNLFLREPLSYPAMPLARQLEHHWFVHPGPLVLGTDPLKYPTPTTDRDQTVSRRQNIKSGNPAHVPL